MKTILRKMLCHTDSPCIVSLMRLIETQSKETLVRWSISYAEEHLLPIYERSYPADTRPRVALYAATQWLEGKIKFPVAKRNILAAHAAAREAKDNPAAQAAARSVGQAAATIHTPTHSLGLAFYGVAAIAYNRVGLAESIDVYDKIADAECAKIEASLRAVAVENEPNPCTVNWNC